MVELVMHRLFPLLFIGFSFGGCGSRRVPTSVATAGASNASSEPAILQKLLLHQEAAARILEVCAQRAARDELKTACTTGSASVQDRTTQLRGLLGVAKGGASNQRHDDQYKELFDRMRNAKGDEFDEAAARAIRVHAREGVTESAECQRSAVRPEVKSFCSDLNASQQRVADNASRWICEWFQDCAESGRSR